MHTIAAPTYRLFCKASSVTIRLELPFPPSVNSLYGGGSKQRRFKSKKYKEWEASCPDISLGRLSVPVHIHYHFYPPSNHKRDGANYMKAPLDYVVSAGVLPDDNWNVVVSESWSWSHHPDPRHPRVLMLFLPANTIVEAFQSLLQPTVSLARAKPAKGRARRPKGQL